MSTPATGAHGHCRLVGADKLPAETGGGSALCEAIERAVASNSPGVSYNVEVTTMSPSMLVASVVVNGRKLPDQKMAVIDRKLSAGSVERFARAIATTVAEAAKNHVRP